MAKKELTRLYLAQTVDMLKQLFMYNMTQYQQKKKQFICLEGRDEEVWIDKVYHLYQVTMMDGSNDGGTNAMLLALSGDVETNPGPPRYIFTSYDLRNSFFPTNTLFM